jgi:hypothetical protein
MVTISLVNRGITSAKCLSIFEYYLYSAYLESMRKDIRTAYDHILISRFQNTLRLVDHVAHHGANYTSVPEYQSTQIEQSHPRLDAHQSE